MATKSNHKVFERQVLRILCSVDRASRFNRVKKNQIDGQIIFSIFRQPLHVSAVSKPTGTTDTHLKTISTNCCIRTVVPLDDEPGFFLDDCLLSRLDWATDSHLKRIQAHHHEVQP
jgi:hypothetical protein